MSTTLLIVTPMCTVIGLQHMVLLKHLLDWTLFFQFRTWLILTLIMDQATLRSPFQDCARWEKGSYMPRFTSVLHWPLFKGNYAIERSNIVSFWKSYSLQITLNDDPICRIDGFRTMVNALLACSHCIIGRFSLSHWARVFLFILWELRGQGADFGGRPSFLNFDPEKYAHHKSSPYA